MKKSLILIIGLCALGLFAWFTLKKRNSSPSKVSKNILIVGTNAEFAPFTFVKNDVVMGFDIDVIKEVAKRLGKEIEIKDMPFDILIPEIQRGSIHVIAAGLTPTPKKEKEVRFSTCYFSCDPLTIISLVRNPLKTIEELTGKDVIVNDGYTADFYMSEIKGPNLKRLPTPAAAFQALQSGRADAYVTAKSTAAPYFRQYGSKELVITPIEDTEECYAIAVAPLYADLVPQINNILDAMMKDGTINQLKKRWEL